jgi:hypothetical protein
MVKKLISIKILLAISCIRMSLQSKVSDIVFSSIIRIDVTMWAEVVSETLHHSSILTRLIASEGFIAFTHRESLKNLTYIYIVCLSRVWYVSAHLIITIIITSWIRRISCSSLKYCCVSLYRLLCLSMSRFPDG